MARLVKGCLYRRGDVYWCRYRYQNITYNFSLQTKNCDFAERELERRMLLIRAAVIDGTFGQKFAKNEGVSPVVNGKLKLVDAWHLYLKCRTRPQSSDATLEQYEYQWAAFIKWVKKKHPRVEFLSQVTAPIATSYLEHLEKRLSSNSYNKHVDVLRRTFQILVKEKQITAGDPWIGIQHKRKNGNRRNAFSVEDAKTIISKARGWMKSLWLVGFYSGQRFCDCVFLKWEQVDFVNGLLVITPRKTRNSSALVVELPMHAELLQHLRDLHAARGKRKSPYVIPRAVAEYQHNRQELAIKLREFLEGCGFQVHKQGTGGETGVRAVPILGFHSCRHTFVSICRNNGVPDSVVQSIVGNSYLLYSHVDRSSKREAVDKLPWFGEQPAALGGQGTATEELDSLNYNELLERQQAIKTAIERRLVKESPLKLVHG